MASHGISSQTEPNKAASLGKVPLGVTLVFYGLELTALGILVSLFTPYVLAGNLALGTRVFQGAMVLLLVAGGVTFVGKLLCLTASSEVGGKPAVILAVLLTLIAVVTSAVWQVTPPPMNGDKVVNVLTTAAFVCFLLFLRKLALFLGDAELGRQASGVLIVGVAAVLSLTGFVAGVLFFLPIVAIGGAVAAAICGVLLLLRYSRLLLAFSRKLKSV